ncbi:TolC family protein [Bacteroides uniformis]|nr:TolC family protein [Bacteroides uniformis]
MTSPPRVPPISIIWTNGTVRKETTTLIPIGALATLTQPLYTGGSLIAQKKVAQADEALAQLTTELTLDQIHYQSDAVYWNASAARAGLKAAATFRGYCTTAVRHHPRPL